MRLDLLPHHITYSAHARGGFSLSNQHHYRAVIDIDDLTDAYMAILESDEWHSGVFNIGHHNLTKERYLDEIAKIIPLINEPAENKGDIRNLRISSDRFEQTFRFRAERSLDETIRPLVEILKERMDLFSHNDFRGVLNMPLNKFLELAGLPQPQ